MEIAVGMDFLDSLRREESLLIKYFLKKGSLGYARNNKNDCFFYSLILKTTQLDEAGKLCNLIIAKSD